MPDSDVESIDPRELKDRIDAGEAVIILDVRVQSEFEKWSIDGQAVESANIPYFDFFDDEIDTDSLPSEAQTSQIVVVCAKGGASEFVAARLVDEAGIDAVNLAGGMNGWAKIYERREITGYDGPGRVYQYQRPSSGCLSYLVVADDAAAVIDPLRVFTDRYRADAEELGVSLALAIDTHVHADHLSGVRHLMDDGVEGVIPEGAAERGTKYADDARLAADGDEFHVGDVGIEAVATPGHTTDMTSYLVGDALLVTGDGLFVESVARPDLEAGDDGAPAAARQLYESLQERVLTLPPATLIAGAHYSEAAAPVADGTYTAQLGELVERMGALSLDREAFVDLILADMPPRPENHQEIIEVNLGLKEIADEEAFALELGPNNCAASQHSLVAD